MLIEESKFRRLVRSEYGGFEGARFQAALDDNPGADPVPVTFGSEFTKDLRTFTISRAEVERYAKIAAEEKQPEEELVARIKPQMRPWILNNRKKMCAKLRESLSEYKHEHHSGVTIVWPIQTPDKVDEVIIQKYLDTYE